MRGERGEGREERRGEAEAEGARKEGGGGQEEEKNRKVHAPTSPKCRVPVISAEGKKRSEEVNPQQNLKQERQLLDMCELSFSADYETFTTKEEQRIKELSPF